MKLTFELYVCGEDDVETTYSVSCSVTPYDPGRIYGPPEKCYPPEGGDVEDIEVTLEGKPIPQSEWPARLISRDKIEELAMEEAASRDDRDDGPDRREDD